MKIENPVWKSCPQIEKIFQALGKNIRFVGGCVRDSLIGKIPSDIDMATPVLPEHVIQILKKEGFEVIPTGISYGTVTVLTKNEPFPCLEITTLRRDIQNDGRKPQVVYTENWQEDALRRDFTFNALYADFDGNVYDFCDGIQDLKNHVVRFIGDPDHRIQEDYLRILRYFRFLALFENARPDPNVLTVCQKNSNGLFKVSVDRARREMFLLIMAKNALQGLEPMQKSGILNRYFPFADLKIFKSFLRLKPDADLLNRLLALSGLSGQNVDLLQNNWRLSKVQAKKMKHIVSFDRTKKPSEYAFNDLFRLAVYFQQDLIEEILSLFEAFYPGIGWNEAIEKCRKIVIPPFCFSGADLVDRVEKKEIGKILNDVREYWLVTDGKASKEELMAYALKNIKR